MFFTTLLVIGLRTLLWYKNKQLDKQYGTLDEQKARLAMAQKDSKDGAEGQQIAVENYGPLFRYVL
jgi:hypothetical protein